MDSLFNKPCGFEKVEDDDEKKYELCSPECKYWITCSRNPYYKPTTGEYKKGYYEGYKKGLEEGKRANSNKNN